MGKLDGKVTLITGGGSGIGLGIARVFHQEGAFVVLAGRSVEKLQEAVALLGGGPRLSFHQVDVTKADQVQKMVHSVLALRGQIDILVNNAGTNIRERTIRQLTPETWDLLIRTNLDGAFFCLHAVLPHMLERKDGVIINISSVAGKRASPLGGTAYSASKFGVTALGLCLGVEERESGIRVCNIYPGEVDTPILEVRPQAVTEEQKARMLKPEDLGAAALFVATLPPHVSVPELIIKPTSQVYL